MTEEKKEIDVNGNPNTSEESGNNLRKTLLTGGFRALSGFLTEMSVQQSKKDSLESAIDDCEEALIKVLEGRRKNRTKKE